MMFLLDGGFICLSVWAYPLHCTCSLLWQDSSLSFYVFGSCKSSGWLLETFFLFPEDGTIAQVCDFFLALESLAYFLGVYQFMSSLATALRSVYKEPARVGGGMILAPPDSVCRSMGPS